MKQEQYPAGPITRGSIAAFARETTLEENGHAPMLLAEGDKGMIAAMLERPPAVFELRLLAMYSAGLAMAKAGEAGVLHQVFFISEAWMSVGGREAEPTLPPSDDPDRKEVLIVAGTNMQDLQSDLVIYEMLRDEEDGLEDLHEFKLPESDDDKVESPLLDAFVAGYLIGVGGRFN